MLWRDAEGSGEWDTVDRAQAPSDAPVTSVGFLLRQDDEWVSVAGTVTWMAHDNEWHATCYINVPAGMVLKVEKL